MESTILKDQAAPDRLNRRESSEETNTDSSTGENMVSSTEVNSDSSMEGSPRSSEMLLSFFLTNEQCKPNPDMESSRTYSGSRQQSIRRRNRIDPAAKPEHMKDNSAICGGPSAELTKPILEPRESAECYKWKHVLVPLLFGRESIFMKPMVKKKTGYVANDDLWKYIRDNFPIYPFSAYTIIRDSCGLSDLQTLAHQHNLCWAGSLNPVRAIINHHKVREMMLPCHRVSDPTLRNRLRASLQLDEVDLCHFVEYIISDSTLCAAILSLDATDISLFMDVLQSGLSLTTQLRNKKRKFDRFVKDLMVETGILPRGLTITNARRVDKDPISGGGFADVWRGELWGKPVAMKVLRIFQGGKNDVETVRRKFCEEALIWQQLKHENILPFFGISENEFQPKLALVSPWMEGGTLIAYLRDHPGVNRHSLIYGIAGGLHYLHMLRPLVVHGDLRAANILIDEKCNPRITDFGLAKIIDSQASSVVATSFNGKGTMRWQAPELLMACRFEGESGGITVKSDVYAFACVCLEVFTGEVPFSNLRDGAVIMAVAVRDERPPRPPEPATTRGLDDSYWSLMESCWVTQPAERRSMDTVMVTLEQIQPQIRF